MVEPAGEYGSPDRTPGQASEIEGLDDLHAFMKLGNHVTQFSFPHMDRKVIAPAIVPRKIPEEDMWLPSLPPDGSGGTQGTVAMGAGNASKLKGNEATASPVTSGPQLVSLPGPQMVPSATNTKPPALPLFSQEPALDRSTNL